MCFFYIVFGHFWIWRPERAKHQFWLEFSGGFEQISDSRPSRSAQTKVQIGKFENFEKIENSDRSPLNFDCSLAKIEFAALLRGFESHHNSTWKVIEKVTKFQSASRCSKLKKITLRENYGGIRCMHFLLALSTCTLKFSHFPITFQVELWTQVQETKIVLFLSLFRWSCEAGIETRGPQRILFAPHPHHIQSHPVIPRQISRHPKQTPWRNWIAHWISNPEVAGSNHIGVGSSEIVQIQFCPNLQSKLVVLHVVVSKL